MGWCGKAELEETGELQGRRSHRQDDEGSPRLGGSEVNASE